MRDSELSGRPLSKVALIGNYLPRKCGIATFTTDTRKALIDRYPQLAVDVYVMEDEAEKREYPSEVAGIIGQNDIPDYLAVAQRINDSGADVVWLQHEYGIFGGPAGELILRLLDRVEAPLVVTLHTILSEPNADQRRVMDAILRRASRIIVMSEMGRRLLQDVHGINPLRIAVIPHGIPDRAFVDTEPFKDRFGFSGRKVLFTFGLLSPNKGIETVIEAMPMITARHPEALYVILGATHPHLVAQEGETYRERLAARAAELDVSDNVCFINGFIENDTLLDYLAAADIYVTPYLNAAQITSGTLSYAIGLGKPVVSTPYWHAEELLADDHGRLVPFGDAKAIADTVMELLEKPAIRETMRQRAYARGRTMIWPRVAEMAMLELESARAEKPLRLRAVATFEAEELHPPILTVIKRLTDQCGIMQHGLFIVPNRDHGYCVDDNARALLLMHQIDDDLADEADRLAIVYASFIQHAWNGDTGRFRNFMSYSRNWCEDAGSEDSCGRSIWAIGATANRARHLNLRIWASTLFDQAAGMALELKAARARSFAILGAVEMLAAHPGHAIARRILEEFGKDLRTMLQQNRRDGWHWFEDNLSYDNARLSEALLKTGMALFDDGLIADGLAALEWLMEMQTAPGGHFRPVGTDSFGRKMQKPMPFDQQPVDVIATIDACAAAYEATRESRWIDRAGRAYGWYLGDNDLELPVATREDGGCHDGLMPDRVNLNQGAESIISYQLACCVMKRLKAGLRTVPHGRLVAE